MIYLWKIPKNFAPILIRSTQQKWMHGTGEAVLYGKEDISSEEKEEISQLCRRIFEIEQELHRLSIALTHLTDDAVFELNFNELVSYGFDKNIQYRITIVLIHNRFFTF